MRTAQRGFQPGDPDAAGGSSSAVFDLGVAYELYGLLLGPIADKLKDKQHLLVVPSGPLTGLPLHLLITERPAASAAPNDPASYRNAAWLIKRHAVSVVPSVASLKALRVLAQQGAATKPMIGFGDPQFGGRVAPTAQAATRLASAATRGYADYWQGALANPDALRSGLAPLPDTADELNAVARNLGALTQDIRLGADASETAVKRARLSDYRVVYFATHGLVAGEVKRLSEPALALTLPEEPSELDDGLLTASEVAQLRLNADWVVLSACNTAAGDTPGAEALSGLARAFFYAGARTLLVSHWAVSSSAATRLATSTFDIMKAKPGIGRAEALRQAMLAYLNDAADTRNVHPAFWGPFSVVGEGAAR